MDTNQKKHSQKQFSHSIFRQISFFPTILRLRQIPHTLINDGIYFQQHIKLHAKQGHGFAAELANDLVDRLLFKKAYITGGNNAKNGYDRIVDNIKIQSKYCKTAAASFSACFDHDRKLKYVDQQIEVPPEQYEGVKDLFQKKGYSPEIVRKGHVSYFTAKKISEFGSPQSLIYDSLQGVYLSSQGFTLSSIILFGAYCWSGRPYNQSIKQALRNSVEVFYLQLTSHIISQQICRTGYNNILLSTIQNALSKLFSPESFVKLAQEMSSVEPYQQVAPSTAKSHLAKQINGQALFLLVIVLLQIIKDSVKTLRQKKSIKCLIAKSVKHLISSFTSFFCTVFLKIKFGNLCGTVLSAVVSIGSSQLIDYLYNLLIKSGQDEHQQNIIYSLLLKCQEEYGLSHHQLVDLIDKINNQEIDLAFFESLIATKSSSCENFLSKLEMIPVKSSQPSKPALPHERE